MEDLNALFEKLKDAPKPMISNTTIIFSDVNEIQTGQCGWSGQLLQLTITIVSPLGSTLLFLIYILII